MKLLGFSWLLGRWRGMDIRFHISMLLSLPVAYWLFKPQDIFGMVEAVLWMLGLTTFVFLHEVGHALAAQLVGVKVRGITLWLLGGLTNLEQKPEKPTHTFFIYAAGPLVNMLLAFVCVVLFISSSMLFLRYSEIAGVFVWAQVFNQLLFSFAILNTVLVVFNLVPVYPLDGGNLLHSVAEFLFGKLNADRITIFVGVPFLGLLILLAVFTRDFVLLFFCVLMALSIASLNRSLLKKINLGLAYYFKRPAYYYLTGDYDRAAQLYTEEIEKQPDAAVNYLTRAGCYLAASQTARALADVERVLRMEPNNLFALELRGELYLMEKNLDAALAIFEQTRSLNPGWAVSYFDIGSIYMERGDLQTALDNFNKAVALQPQMPLFYVIRSIAHFKLGDLSSAHADQDMAVGLSAADALVMVDVNLIVYEGELDWAKDYYNRILDKNPRNALALQGLAEACLVNQAFDEAVALFTRALALNPKEARTLLGRGKAYFALQKMGEAKADFEQVLTATEKLHLRRLANDWLRKI